MVDADKGPALTRREREVFDLLGEGYSKTEIAEKHVVSVKTVEAQVESVKRKLGCRSVRMVIRAAMEESILRQYGLIP